MRALLIVAFALGGVTVAACSAESQADGWQAVSGAGVHQFSTATQHSEVPTETGVKARSTDIIELSGDLAGKILYHPTTVVDAAAGQLTNTGHQVFSGVVLKGEPVLLLDDSFRFELDLASGALKGDVLFDETLAGPQTECRLTVTGAGDRTEAGDPKVTYEGECRVLDSE